ncbi:hypothetical protein DFH06DRAFT_1166209 [Mycena polygramma]|nr:hypothetical protein DFH06DRAFT_1166209 [Mycena polygramma]
MRLGELDAWISVDGVELSEFAVEYSADGKEASCWIPSECDKNFCVHFKHTDSSPRDTVNARLTVDGTSCGSKDLRCRDLARSRIVSGSYDSVAVSAYARRPLLFGQTELTDDDSLLNAAIHPELGSIKVYMRIVKPKPRSSSRSSRPMVWRNTASFETKPLHERSKKAMGHSVKFGAEFTQRTPMAPPIRVVKDLATFVFKYRPIEILRAQAIAPPEVRPAAASNAEVVDLTLDDDDTAEIHKLEARLRALKKKAGKVKVKVETSSVKQEPFTPGEVIDLT